MQLSPSQRQEMVQLRQLFLAKEHSISRQRSETVLMLVELQNSSASLSTERRSSQAYLQVLLLLGLSTMKTASKCCTLQYFACLVPSFLRQQVLSITAPINGCV